MIRCLFIFLALLSIASGCSKPASQRLPDDNGCITNQQIDSSIVPATVIKNITARYTREGLPGITFMARKGNRYWQHQAGLADIEEEESLKACMVWPGYSLSKMYTATAIFKLVEQGKITLEQKLNTCLPQPVIARVPGADKISVRMLLNHSSGIENFWQNPGFISRYIENPFASYTLNDYFDAAQERLFEPGTDLSYSNTNYLLLSLIIDEVTGQPHEKAFQKYIFNPLSLAHTFYKVLPIAQKNNIPELYADTDGSGHLQHYTQLSLLQFTNESGSNSIMATPKDFVDFMHALTHQKILTPASFHEMKKPYHDKAGNNIYGSGLEYFEKNGVMLYGYSGSSFGGRTLLLYNPKTDVCFFVGVNAGAELGGPILEKIAGFMDVIISELTP